MVVRHIGNLTAALAYAERGAAMAPAGLVRAQFHAWALLPALAQQGREREAAAAIDVALVWLLLAPVLGQPDRMSRTVKLALRQTS